MARIALPTKVSPLVAEGVAWASFLESNLDRFQRTLDVPIGARLGCGRFGCVFESRIPWVVKLTRDESEGPIWSYMSELLSDTDLTASLAAFLRVHDVVRIRPDVVFNDEVQPVFAIVREQAEPVFDQVEVVNPRDKYDTSFETALSAQTLKILGVTSAALKRADLQTPVLYKRMSERIEMFPKGVQTQFAELHLAIQGTRSYRQFADVFHRLRWKPNKTAAENMQAAETEAMLLAACSVLERLELSRELGVTLAIAHTEADLIFRDLHLYNIGWRTHRVIDGQKLPQCMVILDPGAMATPYMPEIREVTLLKNAGGYLRNAGLID